MQEANARQLVRRARVHLAQAPGSPVLADENRRLLPAFSAAVQAGDARRLADLCAAETRRSECRRKASPAD
jgi:RNA polymerase sigma-70 factor (ECF subfamily)